MERKKSITIQGIIFDLDGTLIHLAADWLALRSRLQKSLDSGTETFDVMLEQIKNMPYEEAFIVGEEIKGVVNGEVISGAAKTLRLLEKEYKLAIVTRNSRKAALKAVNVLGLSANTIVVGREDVATLKPHPQGLELAIQRFGLGKEATIMIGDTFHDVEAAHAAGIKCVIVKNESLKFKPTGADYYLDGLNQLPDLVQLIGETSVGGGRDV